MAAENPEELLQRTLEFVENHLTAYIATQGTRGHLVNFSHVGVDAILPTLLLKTLGRKSGKELIVPLIYGTCHGEWVVIASKGGAPTHPAWFLNLKDQEEVQFQVATEAFNATWRIAEGDERSELWAFMAKHYPPYNDYLLTAGEREIPVVILKPTTRCLAFEKLGR